MKTLKLSAWMSSIFSIIFSLSLIIELSKTADLITLILSSSFLIFLVVFVEWLKVTELSRKFKGIKSNIYVIAFSFTFSFAVSTIGIWMWLDKSQEINVVIDSSHNEELLTVEQRYKAKTDSINSISYSSEYSQVQNDLNYWKTRSASSIEERSIIRENILKLEDKRTELHKLSLTQKELLKTELNKQKQAEIDVLLSYKVGKTNNATRNHFLSIVFFSMVAFVEFIIIFIQYRIATYFTTEQSSILKMIKDFELRSLSKIDVNKVKYSKFHLIEDWEEIKLLYNLLIELAVITIDGEIKEEAHNKMSNYYLKLNSL